MPRRLCLSFFRRSSRLSLPLLLITSPRALAQVTFNEVCAVANERLVRYDTAGQGRVGYGPAWFDEAFNDSSWLTGPAPLGFGVNGLGTNLNGPLNGSTPSLYARKSFTVSASQAASADSLLLRVAYKDGFVAFLNGREVARSRLGPPRMFIAADATSFSAYNTSAPEVFNLGAASSFLKAGGNVLAIQVANYAIDAKDGLKLDVGLEINNGVTVTTEYTQAFADANGSSATHANTGGTVVDSTTGTIPPNSWLGLSPAVQSSGPWTSLAVVSKLDATGGNGGGGGMTYTFTGSGAAQTALVRGPALAVSQWTAGAITAADLDQTNLSFRFKTPVGMVADLLLEPEGGTPASALNLGTLPPASGAAFGVVGHWRFDDAGATAGGTMATAVSQANAPTLNATPTNAPKFSADVPGSRILDPLTGNAYQNSFSLDASGANARVSVPNHALLNSDSFTIECFIKLIGEPTGYDAFLQRSVSGVGDSATSSQRNAWQLDFDSNVAATSYGKIRSRWDTAGTPPPTFNRAVSGNYIFVDTPSGDGNPANYGTPAPADVYPLGDGANDTASKIWHHIALSYNGTTRTVTLYTDYVPNASMVLAGTFIHPSASMFLGKLNSSTYGLLLDEVRYSSRVLGTAEMLRASNSDPTAFTTFSANLSSATPASQSAFLAAMNSLGVKSFRPVIRVRSETYSASGRTLALDDVSLVSNRQAPISSFVSLGGTLSYAAGIGEPSGGVFDPKHPRQTNNPSEAGDPPPFPDLIGFSDWLELRNAGAAPVDLTGWTLTDTPSTPGKWAFPAGTTIPANGHLLVLCDDQADLPGLAYLHTNFSLGAGGEKLQLYQAGVLRDEFTYPRQDEFNTYGRSPVDGSPGYFNVGTPGAANPAPIAAERCSTPDFSLAGGFYTGAQTLTIATVTAGAEIRYTTDGSEPSATSLLYTAPVTVAPGANDKTGRVIRAGAYKSGAVASGIRSATYLINQNGALKGVPAMCFTGNESRDFYKDHGILAISGGVYATDATAALWSPTAPGDYNMALMHGRAVERPIFLEWFRNDGLPGFAEDAGVRYAGSPHARPRMKLTQTAISPWPATSTEKPSFNLFFRSGYGASQLQYPFLGQDYPVHTFDELRPRAGKNDISNPFIRDELARRVFRSMGHTSVQGTINTLYLNGSYKGFYNTVERYRETFFQEHFGSKEAWDIRIIDTPEVGDSAAWDAMKTSVTKDLTVQANLDAALAQIDLDEMIDYYLFNIYLGTWDWPNNNWVASRERTADGRWRFHVWDAEGAFGNITTKPPNYDTLLTDLRTATSTTGAGAVSQIFRGLYASPEVKLRFADRINHWFFNGNVLDDRDPVNCRIAKLKDSLKSTFAPLLTYTHGTTFSEAFWTNWTTATTANPNSGSWTVPLSNRRSFLFNSDNLPATDISFRTHGLWPATEPVTYSQHGGKVAASFRLALATNATVPAGSVVYYTLDGTDPRLTGGNVAAGARVYSAPLALPAPFARVFSRVKNATTGEWSALTQADFLTDTQPASASNLVVSQIHYHPSNPVASEVAAGYLDDTEFEFLELMAIGPSAVDLTGVKVISGITFDFASAEVRVLSPGGRVLLVKNKTAFLLRHGASLAPLIAGEYLGTLSNSGEQIWITGADGPDADAEPDTIRQFVYSDLLPWPVEPDGLGASLVLRLPSSNPDHSLAANWRASASQVVPGTADAPTYATWAASRNLADPLGNADSDGDGLTNLFEFALGSNPVSPASSPRPTATVNPLVVNGITEPYLTLTLTRPLGLDELEWSVQTATDMAGAGNWVPAEVFQTLRNSDGTETVTYRAPGPVGSQPSQFLRLVVRKP